MDGWRSMLSKCECYSYAVTLSRHDASVSRAIREDAFRVQYHKSGS